MILGTARREIGRGHIALKSFSPSQKLSATGRLPPSLPSRGPTPQSLVPPVVRLVLLAPVVAALAAEVAVRQPGVRVDLAAGTAVRLVIVVGSPVVGHVCSLV